MDRHAPTRYATAFLGRFREDDASGLAAELAYRFLFAIFPFGIFLAALGAFVAMWVGIANPGEQIISGLGDNLPADLASTIRPELERVMGQSQVGVLSAGALLALWAATSGTMTLIKAMNRAFGVQESRPMLVRYVLGLGLTVAGSVGLILAFVTTVGGSLLTQQIVEQPGIGSTAWTAIALVRWPVVFALLVIGVAVLYRVGPNVKPPWRAATAGATLFSAGWLLATFGFALYVANLANYGATYGALAGVIVLMLWLYLTALVLVAGVEFAAVVTRQTEPLRLETRQAEIASRLAAGAGNGPGARIRSIVRRALGGREPEPAGGGAGDAGSRQTDRTIERRHHERRSAPMRQGGSRAG